MWRRIQKFFASFVPALVLLAYIGVMVCLLNRWDSMVAVTLIPFWAWAAAAMGVCLISWILFRGIAAPVVFTIWLVTAIGISEETHGLVRELIQSIDPKVVPADAEILRVVSFHSTEEFTAYDEIAELQPDIVLLQGVARNEEILDFSDRLFGMDGAYLSNGRNAILAKGEFINTQEVEEGGAIHARLRMKSGFLIDITSLQLPPCIPTRLIWKPQTWKQLTERRKENRSQLRLFLGENRITRSNTARLVGGGFNTPAGDDIFRPLESNQMNDAFKKAGEGWGNTYRAKYPILRLDQIWVSDNLLPVKTTTVVIPGSENRAVLSELMISASNE